MKNFLIISGIIFVLIIVGGVLSMFTRVQKIMTVETVQVDPQMKVFLGGGGNSLVLTSDDGQKAIVVDTKMAGAAKKLRSSVRANDVTIINTHFHTDHVSGNVLYPAAKIISGAYTQEQWKKAAGDARYPDEVIQPGQEKVLRLDSETIHVRNMGRAHTFNDLVVYFERRKLLATGDIIFLDRHPVLFASSGASVASWINVLDSLQNMYDAASLMPGHGRMSDKSAIAWMKEYFTSAGDAIGNPQKQTELKEKYKSLASLPGMSGLEKTMKFIENERKNNNK
ncbi:MAG TPA: MBL fold metallo-hydrolase [Chitinivibrionales bacterium]|nr:MBL fold metallo-hydrolase [Chitinivibrionales bacterium]